MKGDRDDMQQKRGIRDFAVCSTIISQVKKHTLKKSLFCVAEVFFFFLLCC